MPRRGGPQWRQESALVTDSAEYFDLYHQGFARVAVAVPRCRVADPAFNAEQTLDPAARGRARRCGAGRLSGTGPVGLHLRRPVPPARAARRLRGGAGAGAGRIRVLCRGGRGRAAAARGAFAVQLRGRRAPRPAARRGAQDLPAELRRVLRSAAVQPGRPCAGARDSPVRPGRALRRRAAVRGAGPAATSGSMSRSARTCGCRSRPRPMRRWPAPRCC